MSTEKLVYDLQEHIKQGKIIEAMEKFYDPEVSMQENANPPTKGRAPNIEREKQFLAQVKTWKGYSVNAIAVAGHTAFVEAVMEFENTAGQNVRLEQVSVQRWKNGSIVHERFYYDASKK